MGTIIIKEFNQIFSSLVGLIAIIIFLIINSLLLFFFSETNILEFGYASMDPFFDISPYIFIQLISAVTMRTFAEEFKTHTYDILITKPIRRYTIILGKFFAVILVTAITFIPTFIYPFTLSTLTLSKKGLDMGLITGAYLGLFLLVAAFIAMGLFASSLTNNSIIAFLISALLCYLFYDGFSELGKIPVWRGKGDFFFDLFAMDAHFVSIRKGVLDTKDVVYFFSLIVVFLGLTLGQLYKREV